MKDISIAMKRTIKVNIDKILHPLKFIFQNVQINLWNLVVIWLTSGQGVTDCSLVPGELTSDFEQYFEKTETPLECQARVKIKAPEANGMTWSYSNHQCWAKYGSSNSTIDEYGCSYCTSCIFGITTLRI